MHLGSIVESFDKLLSFNVDEPFFWCCALVGTGLFIIQLVLSLFGIDHNSIDDGVEIDIDAGKFKWLSKQAISGFLLIFGWAGLTCRKECELSLLASYLISGVGGIATILLNGWIFKIAKKLRSPGQIFKIEDTIGKEATVYQTINRGGAGKISLSLNHLTHEIDATSYIDEDLPSFSSVQIIGKINNTTVLVIPKK